MKTGIFLVCFTLSFALFAQETLDRHAVSVELSRVGSVGMSGLFARYDYMFMHSSHGFFDATAGIGGYSVSSWGDGLAIRQGITYNLGSKRHFLEGGLSGAYYHEYYKNDVTPVHEGYYVGPQIGYRSISKSGFQFRIYMSSYYGADTNHYYTMGFGFGKAFGKISTKP
jgi:hypothetical protein